MSPTVLRVGRFRLFFFSREEPRPHVHVQSAEGEAKFWLEPEVALARRSGLPDHEVRRARELVEEHLEEIRDAWNRHFSG